MASTDFLPLNLNFVLSIPDMIECKRCIWSQHILAPLSPVAFLARTDEYASITAPNLAVAIPSALFIDLARVPLPAWNIGLEKKWVYMLGKAKAMELSAVAVIGWSPIDHLLKRSSTSKTIDIHERPIVQLASISEHTHTLEWNLLISRVNVMNESETIRHSLKYSANFKSHLDLIHSVDRCWIIIFLIRMHNCVLEILSELKITLFESFNVVVEREHHRVRLLLSTYNTCLLCHLVWVLVDFLLLKIILPLLIIDSVLDFVAVNIEEGTKSIVAVLIELLLDLGKLLTDEIWWSMQLLNESLALVRERKILLNLICHFVNGCPDFIPSIWQLKLFLEVNHRL